MELNVIKSSHIKTIISEFNELLNSRLQQFEANVNNEKKIVIETMEVLKKLPIVQTLDQKLEAANMEIISLRKIIKELRDTTKVKLQTNEISNTDSRVGYDDISHLVSEEVRKLEAERDPKYTCKSSVDWWDSISAPSCSLDLSTTRTYDKPSCNNTFSCLATDDESEQEEASSENSNKGAQSSKTSSS